MECDIICASIIHLCSINFLLICLGGDINFSLPCSFKVVAQNIHVLNFMHTNSICFIIQEVHGANMNEFDDSIQFHNGSLPKSDMCLIVGINLEILTEDVL